MLREDNVRRGFFEREQFEAVKRHLPEALQPVATFAYITGWRKREILGLQWNRVDFVAGTVRLDVGTTKSGEGRTFPMTAGLREMLVAQREATEALQRERGVVIPWVFHRAGKPILDLRGAWAEACKAARVPGAAPRLPPDGRQEPGAGGRLALGGDEPHGAQDRGSLPPVCYRRLRRAGRGRRPPGRARGAAGHERGTVAHRRIARRA